MRTNHRERAPRRALRRPLPILRTLLRAGIVGPALAASPAMLTAQFAVDQMEIFLAPHRADSRGGVFRVTNNGSAAAQATLQLADWDRDEAGSNQFHAAGTKPGSCGESLRVTPGTLRLDPGASQDVTVALVDGAMPSAECWSILFIETVLPPAAMQPRTVSFVLRTGVKIYVVPSGVAPGGEIVDMRVRAPAPGVGGESRNGDAALELTFRNTGDRHAVASGTIEFRRADNTTAAKVDSPQLYALPGAVHRVAIPMPKLPAGRYVVLAVVDYGGDDLVAAQLSYEAP